MIPRGMEIDLNVLAQSGGELRSETLLSSSGAHVVVLTSVVADLALTLCSCYLGDLADRWAVSHLRCTSAGNAFTQRVVEDRRREPRQRMPSGSRRRAARRDPGGGQGSSGADLSRRASTSQRRLELTRDTGR